MADLSFNIVALDKAGATFVKLAEQVDRLSEKLERLDRKDVTANVNVRTDDSRKALDSFQNRFVLMGAAIAAASPAIGASIVAGVGAGFIGVAAAAQASNQEVQQAYKGLWQDVVTVTRNSTDQLVPTFVAAANQMDDAVQSLAPQLERAFAAAGPGILALTAGVTDAATNAMPGLTTAMQNSLPAMEGASLLMGQLGAAGGQALADLSQHSDALGVDLQSFGSIVSSVVSAAVDIVGTLSEAWADNAGSINGAIAGVTASAAELAAGALPLLTAALGASAALVQNLTDLLGPLAPVLGTVGGAALALWAALKLAAVATLAVKALAGGVVTLGGHMEAAAVKSGAMIAGMRGVAVASSTTAATVTAAGRATATAAVTMGASLATIAGPLGLVLIAGAALYGVFASAQDQAAESAQKLAANVDTVTNALIANHGVANQATEDAIKQTDAFKEVAKYADDLGLSQTEMAHDVATGATQLRQMRDQLADTSRGFDKNTAAGAEAREQYQRIIDAINGLLTVWDKSSAAAAEQQAAQQRVARSTVQTAEFQSQAAAASRALGIALGAVTSGYVAVIATGAAASNSAQDVAAAFLKSALAVAQAQQAITDHFAAADRAVTQAEQSLADANRSAASASRQVADAHHAAAAAARQVTDANHALSNARRSLADATAGVTTAQNALVRAQQQEQEAHRALHAARVQAIQDLKELHLQLADQQVSEQQARVRLFDVTRDAAKLGVTAANAQKLAMQEVNEKNEPQIKAALDLLSAQNSLNNTLNSGQKLRKDVADADRRGVDGAKGVVSAQQQVRNAHEQVISAQNGLVKAQQQVTDAAYGVVKAQQQVADASYGVQRAQQAVTDAEYQRARASDRVRLAQLALNDAQAAASRTLDITTKAGQTNLNLLLGLWAAIQATGMPVQDRYNSLVSTTARALGIGTDAAAKMLKQLGLIPKDFKYKVTAVAGADLQEITKTTVNGVTIFQSSLGSGGIASAGRLATGGPVVGPGTKTSDDVLLWGSAGEYMQPADAVDHYGIGFMEAVRSKRLKVMGGDGAAMVPGYAAGGLIEAIAAYTNLSTAYVTDVNALKVAGLKHPPQLPRYTPNQFPAVPGGGLAGWKPSAGVAQWASLVLRVLAELHQPASLLPNVLRRMNQESGGNPRAINLWDSNAAKGTPSIGLMQTIGPTFNAYAGPYRSRGIYDPLANIYAGLNYAIHRYPSLRYAMDKPGGYRNGGWLMPGQLAYNETSKPEPVLSSDQWKELTESRGPRVEKHYHLNAYVANHPVDLAAQYRRMELEAGLV